jgi:hypothetical protein
MLQNVKKFLPGRRPHVSAAAWGFAVADTAGYAITATG